MISLRLIEGVEFSDWFDVYCGRVRIGQITPCSDGWAVYLVDEHDRVQEIRIATTKTINEGVKLL